ncbi:hypothetical protein [Kribbella sp. NPDC004536]
MSPRAVDKRARPGNEHQVARPTTPETPNAVTALQTSNRVSQKKPTAKAS